VVSGIIKLVLLNAKLIYIPEEDSVRKSKRAQCATIRWTDQLMLYRGIIAYYCDSHKEHINKLCGQSAEFVNGKAGGTYSDHWPIKGYTNVT